MSEKKSTHKILKFATRNLKCGYCATECQGPIDCVTDKWYGTILREIAEEEAEKVGVKAVEEGNVKYAGGLHIIYCMENLTIRCVHAKDENDRDGELHWEVYAIDISDHLVCPKCHVICPEKEFYRPSFSSGK